MIELSTEMKLYILGGIIALTQLPKILPSAETIKGVLAKIDFSKILTGNNLVLVAVAAMLFMPSQPSVTPTPEPVPVVQKDALDTATDVYRELMYDVWLEYSAKKPTFKDDAEALKWINEHQVAAYTAAHADINARSAKEAAAGGNPADFANDFKNRSL